MVYPWGIAAPRPAPRNPSKFPKKIKRHNFTVDNCLVVCYDNAIKQTERGNQDGWNY